MNAGICEDCDRSPLNSGPAGKEGNTSWHKRLTQKVHTGQNNFEGKKKTVIEMDSPFSCSLRK